MSLTHTPRSHTVTSDGYDGSGHSFPFQLAPDGQLIVYPHTLAASSSLGLLLFAKPAFRLHSGFISVHSECI